MTDTLMNRIKQIIKEAIDFFYQLYLNWQLILTLSIRDFENKYIRNFFGFIWAILDPLAFVVILYFVFGPRYGNLEAMPFAVYLITGQIAYELFNSSLQNMTLSINEHSFLLKKINFRVAILPIVTLLSNLMIHSIVIGICIIILVFNQIYPSIFWFQILYYIFSLSFFLISLAWFTSSVYLFFPDINNIITIISRILFFVTPIFWSMRGLPENTQRLLKFNPLYYIVNGYRECLIYHKGFWLNPWLTLYFWSLSLLFLVIGVIVYKKLRPHFADVVA